MYILRKQQMTKQATFKNQIRSFQKQCFKKIVLVYLAIPVEFY